MSRSLKLLAIFALTALALTACGKKGALERPVAEGEAAPASKSEPKEHRGTILDGLLL